MASCGFATLVGGSCGSSADNPANVQCVVVGSCAKSIQGHLRNFRVFGDSALDCESKLILARAGKRVHIPCIYQAKLKVILIIVNLYHNLHPKPSMREPRRATPRNRWLCMLAVLDQANCHASCTIHCHVLSMTVTHNFIQWSRLECYNICQSM